MSLRTGFLYREVAVREAGDLRLVSDAQHLVRLRDFAELDADRFADTSADAGIDLVEHDRAGKLGRIRDCFQHQHQTRSFTTGCDACQRLEILAGIR